MRKRKNFICAPATPAAKKQIAAGFADPPHMAKEAETEQEALDIYRRVRDEIKQFFKNLPQLLA